MEAKRTRKTTNTQVKAKNKFKSCARKRKNETFTNSEDDESSSTTVLWTKPSYKGLDGDDDSDEAYIPSDGESSEIYYGDESNFSSDDERKPKKVAKLKNSAKSTSRSSALSSSKKFNSTANVHVKTSFSTEDQESSNGESSKQRSSDEDTGTSQSEKCVDMKCSDSDIFSRGETDEEEGASVCHDQCCQSNDDAIINEPLEGIHICWITLDGESRPCYNLDTLRKVSWAKKTNNLLDPPRFQRKKDIIYPESEECSTRSILDPYLDFKDEEDFVWDLSLCREWDSSLDRETKKTIQVVNHENMDDEVISISSGNEEAQTCSNDMDFLRKLVAGYGSFDHITRLSSQRKQEK